MIALALELAAAFNLICNVTYTGPDRRPSTLIMRVDLEARRYCMDDCRQTMPIQSVTDSEIRFHDGQSAYSNTFVRRFVNRESGYYQGYIRSTIGGQTSEILGTGTCRRAPFTGFPTRRF